MIRMNNNQSQRSIITHNCEINDNIVISLLKYLSECQCDIIISEIENNNLSFIQLLRIAIEKCDKWLDIPNLNDLEYTAYLYVILLDHVYNNIDKTQGCVLLELFLNKLITCNFGIRSQLTKLKFVKQWFVVMRDDNDRVGIWCKYLIKGCSLRKFTTFLLPSHEELMTTLNMDIPILIRLDLLTESLFIITNMISQPESYNIGSVRQVLNNYFKLLFQNVEHIITLKCSKPEISMDISSNSTVTSSDNDDYHKSSYMILISNNILKYLVSNIRLLALMFNQNLDENFNDVLCYITHHVCNVKEQSPAIQNISDEIIASFNKLENTPMGHVFKLIRAITSPDNDGKMSIISSILNDDIRNQLNVSSPSIYLDIFKKIDFVFKLQIGLSYTFDDLTKIMPSISSDRSTANGIESFLIHLHQNQLFQCEIDSIHNTVTITGNAFHSSQSKDKRSFHSSIQFLTDMAENLKIISQFYQD